MTLFSGCAVIGAVELGDGSIRAYLSHRRTYPNEPHGAGPVVMALAGAAASGLEA